MMEMKLPNWARAIIVISAVMQLMFGLTLLFDPGRVAELWPWPLPPLTARLLGASTLVSVPMALLVVWINRFVVALIPLVMMLTYRVLQLLAGAIHHDRFAPDSLVTWNYFGGGLLMAIAFGYPLYAGLREQLEPASPNAPLAEPMPWRAAFLARRGLSLLGSAYLALGLVFLFFGGAAKPLWFDAAGLTPLTARLFASPLTGLGLGLILVSRASDWRQIVVPAIGMVTIGVFGTLSLILDQATFQPQSNLAWFVAATPLVLLGVGLALLWSKSKEEPDTRTSGAMKMRNAA
jgi:hypothetical protein